MTGVPRPSTAYSTGPRLVRATCGSSGLAPEVARPADEPLMGPPGGAVRPFPGDGAGAHGSLARRRRDRTATRFLCSAVRARSSTDRASDYGSEGWGVRISSGARCVETDDEGPWTAVTRSGALLVPGLRSLGLELTKATNAPSSDRVRTSVLCVSGPEQDDSTTSRHRDMSSSTPSSSPEVEARSRADRRPPAGGGRAPGHRAGAVRLRLRRGVRRGLRRHGRPPVRPRPPGHASAGRGGAPPSVRPTSAPGAPFPASIPGAARRPRGSPRSSVRLWSTPPGPARACPFRRAGRDGVTGLVAPGSGACPRAWRRPGRWGSRAPRRRGREGAPAARA